MSTPAWRKVGDIKGPQGGPGLSVEVIPFFMQGSLRTAQSVGRFPIVGGAYRVASVAATVEGAPLGAPVIIDVRANGASIYDGAEGNRPRIEPGTNMAVAGESNVTVLTDGDYLNCDIVQVGSILPGTFLTVAIRLWRGGRDTSRASALAFVQTD